MDQEQIEMWLMKKDVNTANCEDPHFLRIQK